MDVEEPNPGRLAKRDEKRRQRRSVFMTALIGATVTAVLAAAAAFRIKDAGAGGKVKIVTTTTTVPPVNTTADSEDTTLTTIFVPTPGNAPAQPKPKPATTTSTATTTTTAVPYPPFPIPIPPLTSPPVTSPPTASGRAKVVWGLNPGGITLQSGGQANVTLTATNEGNRNGLVVVPPCPAAPRSYSVNRSPAAAAGVVLDNACHPGEQVLVIRPGQHISWTDTISATSDATRTGAALSPGSYLVLVNQSPSPVMFLRMTVTS